MGSILLIALVLFYISYSIISEKRLKTRRLESFSTNLRLKRQGDRCYGCGFDISDDSYQFDIENFKLCDSCRRDESIRSVLCKWPSLNKFNKLVLSRKFEKILISIICIDIAFIILIIIMNFFIKNSLLSSGIGYSNYILCVYWILNNYRVFIVYKNKQKIS